MFSRRSIELPTPENVFDALQIFGVCLFLLAVMAIFMLVRLPRLLAMFGTWSEWREGYVLRHVSIASPARRVAQGVHRVKREAESKEQYLGSSSSHTLHANRSLRMKGRRTTFRYPPHISSCHKSLRPFLRPMRARISPGFSIGQFLLISVYFSVLAFPAFYNSNLFLDQSRTAWIAVSQFPFIFAFAQKSSFLGAFFGFGYEKINFLHRFAGQLVVLASNIHALHFLYKWSFNGTLGEMIQIQNGMPVWGIIALFCVDVFYFFSTPYVREKAYNLFFRSHIMSMSLVLPATYMHKPATLPYILASAAVYILDRLLRLLKSRITSAYIRPLPDLDVTRVEIPSINAGWRAGQHIRLRVLTLRMGWFAWAETHPFTIASAGHTPEGMVLLCKRAGDWTRKLFDIAKISNAEGGMGTQIKVFVEGPYGGPGHTIYSSFSAAVLIAGGSGITYALSVIQDLIQKDLKGESRVKSIDLVWSVPDPVNLSPLLPLLSSLIQESVHTPFRVYVFYTRAPTGKQPPFFTQTMLNDTFGGQHQSPQPSSRNRHQGIRTPSALGLPPGVMLSAGRPKFSTIFEDAIAHAVALGSGAKDDEPITGMVVGVCGPVNLADDVSKAVSSIDPIRRDQVGGVEICEEVFGW